MKSFPSVRIIKIGDNYIAVKEKVEELWLMPQDELEIIVRHNLDYNIRNMLEDMEKENEPSN